MAWSFNPFTGNLDLTGSSGAVVFEGEVETFADLPEVVGDPPVGSSYLVRTSTGVWLVNRKQAGIWIRSNNTGVRDTDWTYGGDYPVNSVNGQTGNVSLTASSVGAAAATHASTHHTGGTDALAAHQINGQTIFSTGSPTYSTDQTLGAARALQLTVSNTNASGINLTLPVQSDGTLNGDTYVIIGGSTVSGPITIRRINLLSPLIYQTLATITATGQQYRFRSAGAATGSWSLVPVDTHEHAASAITSGVFDNARINFAAPPAIGNTTPNSGAFTTLSANNGTITASAPALDLAQTWNNAAVTFTGLRLNATNTASATASLLADFQVNGSTVAHVRRDGVVFGAFSVVNAANVTGMWAQNSGNDIAFPINNTTRAIVTANLFGVGNAQIIGWGSGGSATNTLDTQMHRDAADTIAFRRTTNPQTFRLYNTFTDASNHERGFMRWSSNVLQIGTEKAGTGSARNLEFHTDNTFRARIQAEGLVLSGNSASIFIGNPRIYGSAEGNTSCSIAPFGAGNVIIDSGLLKFHGVSSSFPALKRSSTALQVRLADDSADAPLSCGAITASSHISPSATNSFDIGTSSVRFRWGYFFTGIALGATSTGIGSSADGVIQLRNNNNADFGRLQFGGTTSSFPALKRSTTTIQVRLADDSGDAGLSCSTLTLSDNLSFGSGDNVVLSTTTGTQIGTATNQLLGFYGATPVDRPATVADPAGGGTVDTEARTAINDIIDRLQELGLIA